jgi:hypothetical protein
MQRQQCNAEVTGWLRRRRLDERAFLLRHLEINQALALAWSFERARAVKLKEVVVRHPTTLVFPTNSIVMDYAIGAH